MNESMGNIIVRLRKEHEMTQEQLANALGITFQAVSKWENGISSPDISTLPLLADLFGVSIDELFGREPLVPLEEPAPTEELGCDAPTGGVELPWPDDKQMLHVALFAGHTLIGGDAKGEYEYARKNIEFQYEGPALNIWSDFSVSCGNVQGNVTANGSVECGGVEGSVSADGNVDCGDVVGNVSAGGSVDCSGVGGDVYAGGNVDCGGVGGSVNAGGSVDCGAVIGSVMAANVDRGPSFISYDSGFRVQNHAKQDDWDPYKRIERQVDDIVRISMKMSEDGKSLGKIISDTVENSIGKVFRKQDTGKPKEESDPQE